MTDISDTIIPKSDQLNSDDLIAGPRTIKITGVSRCAEAEQPIAVRFDGDNGKPYKPCKSMRRVMIAVWGADATQYDGRSMTLFRDASVTWGGMEVGGIRISHMSHMDGPMVMALTATKKTRKPFRVLQLVEEPPPEDRAAKLAATLCARFDAAEDVPTLAAIDADAKVTEQRAWLAAKRPELARDVDAAAMGAQMRTGNDFPGDRA